MAAIVANKNQYLELEKIALGAFAPLKGFMNKDDFTSVVKSLRLTTGQIFPLPVVLDVPVSQAQTIKPGMNVPIVFNNEEVGRIAVESVFTCDKAAVVRSIFGTDDHAHPGVAHFYAAGSHFVGGAVTLLKRAKFEFSEFELLPEETKALFCRKNWTTIAGFQTRNVPHRAHEYLQRLALELVDGLFIQPLVGKKKVGDYTPQAILAGYQRLINDFLPTNRIVLGILSTAMRYAGPREAVFHALIRRNYGCTHFVIGRDQAGVGNYYGKYESRNLALRYQDELGIKILPFAGPYYCSVCGGIVSERTCEHGRTQPDKIQEISGTLMRKILLAGDRTHKEWMRPEIVDSLQGLPLFVDKSEEGVSDE